MHHIVPQRFNGSDTRENLVPVCERCHKKLEALYDARFYDALGIDDETGERESHIRCDYNCDEMADFKCDFGGGVGYYCTDHAAKRDLHEQAFVILESVSGATAEDIEQAKRNIRRNTKSRFASTEGLDQ